MTVLKRGWLAVLPLLLSACAWIDEDLADCETPVSPQPPVTLSYEVSVPTALGTQVQTVLESRAEHAVARQVETVLGPVFEAYAHDLGLSFYGGDTAQPLHDSRTMDARRRSFALELPAGSYRHLALANAGEEPAVETTATAQAATFSLGLAGTPADTVGSQRAGLFAARRSLSVVADSVGQEFDVVLHMANCASVLVVSTTGAAYNGMRVLSSDMADGFLLADSVFTYGSNPLIRDERMTGVPAGREVFYAVSFPSHDTAAAAHQATRAAGGDDRLTGDEAERIWRKFVYVTLPDGTVTRTVLNVRQPLCAGQAMIIYAMLQPDGSLTSPNVEVGTSVTLNWQDGLEFRY